MTYCQLCRTEYPEALGVCPKHGLRLVQAERRDRLVGTRLRDGTYLVEQLIGTGGMGKVYRATQFPLKRAVAIKVVEPASDAAGMIKRFYQEASLLAQVDHANVVTIHDFGNTGDGMFYMVMQFLKGTALKHHVQRGRGVPVAEAVAIFHQVCAGVGAAHSMGMLHRDLKPSNIFLARQSGGERIVKVLDFGLAKAVGDGTTIVTTSSGMLMGTPGYIAPELIGQSSAHATIRSDIYALGALLYYLLTGEHVHRDGTNEQILARQLMQALDLDALASRDADLQPELLRQLILKAMAMDPADRHQSCSALLEAFRVATRK